ncbi:hypothetical protein GEMRC1_004728 [Eukaryota sp. GEM-RC1]
MTTLPPVPDVTPDLASLSPAELQSLVSDENAFSQFIENHPYNRQLQTILDSVTENNHKAASHILSQEPIVSKLQQELTQLRAEHDGLYSKYRDLAAQIRSKYGASADKSQVKRQLEQELADAATETDSIDMKFADGDISLADYLKLGLEAHKKATTIRLKMGSL